MNGQGGKESADSTVFHRASDRSRRLTVVDLMEGGDLMDVADGVRLRISDPQAERLTCADAGCGRGVVALSAYQRALFTEVLRLVQAEARPARLQVVEP